MTRGIQALKALVDRTTTYRLMLYYLAALFIAALILAVAGVIPYSPLDLLWSLLVLIVAAWLSNELCAKVVGAVMNLESVYITALILALVVPPAGFLHSTGSLVLAGVAALAMASKYILAWRRKHLFNPAAFALALAPLLFGVPAVWWVSGTLPLLILVVLGGLILVYKLRRFDLVAAFGAATLVTIVCIAPNPLASIVATLQYSAIFFFAFVMLTEPSTMPVRRVPRLFFGALVGALFILSPTVSVLHFSPELALLVGNLFAFCINPKGRYRLSFVERRPLAKGIYEYLFSAGRLPRFVSGQYLEWTLPGVPYDARGNRRYFTIASAPEDEHLALGVRFYPEPSAFKRTLAALSPGTIVTAVSPAGDFTLPKNTEKKLAFLAGGIGVTPFVSMARHMTKSGERRDAILLYCAQNDDEVAYKEVFVDAARLGLRTSYVIGDILDASRITCEIPDYATRTFYLSGPPRFVDAMKKVLRGLGVSRSAIATDFFPGLAQ